MTKAAVFAATVLLGFANIASAVDITFSGLGVGNNTAHAAVVNGPNYTLTYANSPLYWSNTGSNFFYGTNGTTIDTSYMPGTTNPWQVTIGAAAGFEILFDGYTVARAPSSGNVNISVNGTTNDALNQATVFTAGHTFTRAFATKPTGTSVILSWTDGTGNDVAIDSYSFTVQAIPEPTVLAPMALAGMGMFLRRRRA